MKVIIKKDWEWFLAEVEWKKNIFAYWESKEEALKELNNVVDMLLDYYNEEVSTQKTIKNLLKTKNYSYAV